MKKISYFININDHDNFSDTSFDCEVELQKGDFVKLHTDKGNNCPTMIEFRITKRTYITEVKQWIFKGEEVN